VSVETSWGSLNYPWVGNRFVSHQRQRLITPSTQVHQKRYQEYATLGSVAQGHCYATGLLCLNCTFDIDLRRVQDPAEGFILNYTLLIGDASFSNFQKVCQITGALVARCLMNPFSSIDNRLEGHATRRTE
jgi:hypothetical protein